MNKKLQEIRKGAIEQITNVLTTHLTDRLDIAEFSPGESPIVREDEYDDNNTFTLDHITLDKNGYLVFSASSSCDSIDIHARNLDTDTLCGIAEWLEDNKEEIEEYFKELNFGLTERQKEGVKEHVNQYLGAVFTDNVERNSLVDAIIEDIYIYIMECCDWEDFADDEYSLSDVEIAVQSILYHKVTD